MSSFSDAGDIVTGGLLAGAVEPGHGRQHAGPHPSECLNCGAKLTGPYCAACGQNGHVHRTIGAIWHELMHGVLHFDGKIWRTLPELAFRPGALTRRYVRGERAKFVSPLALFLFSALLMYATYSLLGHHGSPHANAQESARALTAQVERADERIADAEKELQAPDISAARRARLQERIASSATTAPSSRRPQRSLRMSATRTRKQRPPGAPRSSESSWIASSSPTSSRPMPINSRGC